MAAIVSMRKDEEKTKKLSCQHLQKLEMPETIFLKFSLWTTKGGGHHHTNFVLFCEGSIDLDMHKNCIIVLRTC